MSLYTKFLDWAGLGDLKRRQREWRCQQIDIEIQKMQEEIAALGAAIGAIQRERAELARGVDDLK